MNERANTSNKSLERQCNQSSSNSLATEYCISYNLTLWNVIH